MGSDDWLFGYGGTLDSPAAAVLVPEGMTTGDFLLSIGNSITPFVKAVQEGHGAASRGDLDAVDQQLAAISALDAGYASRGKGLRGVEAHNRYIMGMAIAAHVRQGNPVTDHVRELAAKYSITL
jgi:hypothetical protein